MLLACSHLVLASADVPRITQFFGDAFAVTPHFANDLFAEFVLASGFRVAFFKLVGASATLFSAAAERTGSAIGVTVDDVDAAHAAVIRLDIRPGERTAEGSSVGRAQLPADRSHGNRWEVTQSPGGGGMPADR